MKNLLLAAVLALAASAEPLLAQGQLRFFLRSDPKTLNPWLVEDEASEMVRYLTGGVLIRVNRQTQALQPELATSWKLSKDARQITLQLRKNVHFSDGSPFDSADVVHTFRSLMSPDMHSATADAFRTGNGTLAASAAGPHEVVLTMAAPLPGVARLLDQVAIQSSRSPAGKPSFSGPFQIAEYKPGSHVLLMRNGNYWKKDTTGRQLPYLESVRLGIQSNRELEALAFHRGEVDLISSLDARTFGDLEKSLPSRTRDLGPALDSEFFWFNQVRTAPVADHKKAWFRSTAFRQAVSLAVNRSDIVRIVYRGHAVPAAGPYPPANRLFHNPAVTPHVVDVPRARRLLEAEGFTLRGGVLRDTKSNPVTFTLITNAGNRAREQMAALIQRDLKAIGIQMNIATLDFPALIERMVKTWEYEACLLGLVNVDPDPNGMQNVWLSSGANHQWNPKQAKPETAWEAEIDRLMLAQTSATSEVKRRADFNRVQEIIAQQEPFIYLVHPNALAAVSDRLKNIAPGFLRPQLLWNVESLQLPAARPGS